MWQQRIRPWVWDNFPATRPVYKYNALPTNEFFRLLVLEPGTGKQPLCGSLHACELDQAPYFEAISYVWGPPDRYIRLICDDQKIFITPSLSDVLHRVRLPNRPRTLWTDLVCINQEDLDEKGSQVSLMGDIYRRSDRTLIHIGTQDDGHGEAVQALLDDIDQNVFANLQQEWDSAPFVDEDHPIMHDSRWEEFRHLINTPWFRRGWVVQEAAHAQDGVVLWGDHQISWTMIMKTFTWTVLRAHQIVQNLDLDISDLHTSCFSVAKRDEVRPFMSEDYWNNTCRFLDTFHSGKYHHFSDPRDRIYAFYNLPARNRSDKFHIIPSYHKSFLEVCRDFALNYLDVYDDLDLLLYTSHDEETLESDFPSWIPLWNPEKYRGYDFHHIFAAGGPVLIQNQEPKFSLGNGGDNLLVSGLRIAKVQMASEILCKEELTFEAIMSLWSKVCGMERAETTAECDRLSMFLWALCFGTIDLPLEVKRPVQNLSAFALEMFKTATVEEKRAIHYRRWEKQAKGGNAQRFLSCVQEMAEGRRFIVTNRGFGLATAPVQEEDECVIIRGGKMPFLLRKADGIGNYKFIGTLFHSSKYEYEIGNTGLYMNMGLDHGRDWEDWDLSEEKFCLL